LGDRPLVEGITENIVWTGREKTFPAAELEVAKLCPGGAEAERAPATDEDDEEEEAQRVGDEGVERENSQTGLASNDAEVANDDDEEEYVGDGKEGEWMGEVEVEEELEMEGRGVVACMGYCCLCHSCEDLRWMRGKPRLR
jgi:hypothetical protein